MRVIDLEFHVTLILIDNLIPEQGYTVLCVPTHPPCMIRVKTPLLEVIWEPGLIFLGDAQELALLD